MKELLDVSKLGCFRTPVGRVGLMFAALVIGTEQICPVTGVHGNPVCQVRSPVICQPPRSFPVQLDRLRKNGRPDTLINVVEGLASKSEGAGPVCGVQGAVWVVATPGPPFES